MRHGILKALIFAVAQSVLCVEIVHAADPLPSWNDGAAKKAIVEFVSKVTKEGGPEFVPSAERIATFDNDGTLWAEQPMYFQLLFALDRVKALAPQHPEWKDKEPFASLLKGDVKGALAGGEPAIFQIVMATHASMTTEEFEQLVTDWVATAKHPVTKRPYTEMVYQPMLEVLAYLNANGFKTFIVSGGGVEFMRPWVQKTYGIPPERVIGSSAKLRFDLRDGTHQNLIFLMTKQANPLPYKPTLAAGRSPPLGIRMATCKCFNGPAEESAHGFVCTSIILMRRANGPTTASRT